MLSKKGRLLYALHTVKTLFRDAGIENDEKLTQEEVDRADELQQIAFPDEWKDHNPNDNKRTSLDLVYEMGDKFK